MPRGDLGAPHPERVPRGASDAIRVHGMRPAEIPKALYSEIAERIAGRAGEFQLSSGAEAMRDGQLGHPASIVVTPARRLETCVARDDEAARVEAPGVRDATGCAVEPTFVGDDVRVEGCAVGDVGE